MSEQIPEEVIEEIVDPWAAIRERFPLLEEDGADEAKDADGAQWVVTRETQWGVALSSAQSGKLFTVRWNPAYGRGVSEPYTLQEAKNDAATRQPGVSKVLVSRVVTTMEVTTPWERADK